MSTNPYQVKTAGNEFLSGIAPYLQSAEAFQGMGGGGIMDMVIKMMGLNPSLNPGRTMMNNADNQFQSSYMNQVRMSSLLATNDLSGNNTLMQVLRGSAGDIVHGRAGFMKQYNQAITQAGVMAPFYQSDMLSKQGQARIRGMAGSPEALNGIARDAKIRDQNISSFFSGIAETYGKDNMAFGGGNLEDAGKIGAEMVRTGGDMFDGGKFKDQAAKLKKNVAEFTSAANELKGVLGGDAMHALDVMNSAFGVNTTATFRDNAELLSRQATGITHTARLTGTSASNIMRLSGVAGGMMERVSGSRLGSLMVGTMAAQGGQAGDLRFINEGKFRSMQTTRLAGAATSDTAKRVSGAYAAWRNSDKGKKYESEAEAYDAFNNALRDAAGGDTAKMGDVNILREVSGVSSNQGLLEAGNTERARLFRASDTSATAIAKSRQIGNTRAFRQSAVSEMMKERGVGMTDKEIAEFSGADEATRRKMLKDRGINDEGFLGSVGNVLTKISGAFGYGDDASFRGAVRADKKAAEIRVQVAARQDLEKTLGIKETSGWRSVLTMYDKFAGAKDEATMRAEGMTDKEIQAHKDALPTFNKFVGGVLGVSKTDLASFKVKEGIFKGMGDKLTGRGKAWKGTKDSDARNLFVEAITTMQSGTLSEEDQKTMQENMQKFTTTGDQDAFNAAITMGTKKGFTSAMMKEEGITGTTLTDKRKAGLLKTLGTEKDLSKTERANLEKAIRAEGLDSQVVQEYMRKDEDFKDKYTKTADRGGFTAASDPLSRIVELLLRMLAEWGSGSKPPVPLAKDSSTEADKPGKK